MSILLLIFLIKYKNMWFYIKCSIVFGGQGLANGIIFEKCKGNFTSVRLDIFEKKSISMLDKEA